MTEYSQLIDQYLAGPQQLKQLVAGLADKQLDAVPIPCQWSTRQVVCHIADFEAVFADRMKRVIAECEPTFFGGDPDVFAARLAYEQRDVTEEVQLIEKVRRQMARIFQSLAVTDFQRIGNHSEDGSITLATLLQQITHHIPHHVHFIKEKRRALDLSGGDG